LESVRSPPRLPAKLLNVISLMLLLTFRGQEGIAQRIGPLEAPALVEEMDERGLDSQEFLTQLRASQLPMLTKLAQEIQDAQAQPVNAAGRS